MGYHASLRGGPGSHDLLGDAGLKRYESNITTLNRQDDYEPQPGNEPCADMKAHLILMLKYPQPGVVKTRLIPALGERRACELYRSLVRHTLHEARQFAAKKPVALVARVANAPGEDAVRQWLGDGICFQPQGDGNLGQRMERAVQAAFAEGATSVMVIGADCPRLTSAHLELAAQELEGKDVILGPATDGGYYLIGFRRFLPELFDNISWSSEAVLEETLAAVKKARVEWGLLETFSDLDLPEDLHLWAQSQPARDAGAGKLSIIIPSLNEASDLPQTLDAARRGQPHEIIVVDGGSTDATVNIARSKDAIVLGTSRCRAGQLNRGAAIATGEYLLFLHADTILPIGYAGNIPALLGQPGVVGGAFTFAIAGDFAGRRLVERATNWRARRWQFPYGDQALFLRRQVFARLGGFPEMPIMEDYEFVRRLRRLGRIAIAPDAAVTSGRRWQRLGWLRTTLANRAVILAYHLGVSPARLAGWYRGQTARRSSDASPSPDAPKIVGINQPARRSHL
jgi:uncharacterized protein